MPFKTPSLTPELLHIIRDRGTEHPFTGEYDQHDEPGTYLCRQCGLALYRAQSKFHSGCGWPSFDEEIADHVKRTPDPDGRRTEITCARCNAHLGHVFHGEGFTAKNTRHCVNSLSLDFVTDMTVQDTEEAIIAAGCFWGVEYYFKRLPGVVKVEVGYSGGSKSNPTYKEVCNGDTGHVEAVRMVYDSSKLNYEDVIKYFFEIHNPAQIDGQGPDIGSQYRSAIFYYNDEQKAIAQQLLSMLEQQGMRIATKLWPVSIFWRAEEYHQDYYTKTGREPYCHQYTKRFA
jgi:peptide methionine sulfoxide reductase msrA/msrB